jgi:hypothetical protein
MEENFAVFDPDQTPPAMRSNRCMALVRYWNSLRRERAMPRPDEIDPADMISILPHVMMVGISYDPFRALYRLVGTEVVRFAKLDFTGCYVDTLVFQEDDPKDWTVFYREVVEARRPGFGVTYWPVEGMLHRWIEFAICPLSSDGITIDRCVSVEDYEHLNYHELNSLPPVLEQ